MERHFAAINNFAMFLDDEDVAQMLPVRGDLFEQGVSLCNISPICASSSFPHRSSFLHASVSGRTSPMSWTSTWTNKWIHLSYM